MLIGQTINRGVVMNTLKLAKTWAGSRSDVVLHSRPGYAKLFSSIQDIAELLRLDNPQKQEMNGQGPQFHHRRVKAGELIYRLGQPFESLYVVRFGFLKIMLRNSEGDERVLSFPMKGNLLGLDGLFCNRYGTEAIALTDCELIVIPFKLLLAVGRSCHELEKMIYVAISREIMEEHAGISLSGPLKSEARVAGFLEKLAKQHAALGYSSQEMSLPMTRRDIGCYLGLTLETVSRTLSALAEAGVISVRRKDIKILKPELLHLFQSSRSLPQQKIQLTHPLSCARPLFNKTKPANRLSF